MRLDRAEREAQSSASINNKRMAIIYGRLWVGDWEKPPVKEYAQKAKLNIAIYVSLT